MLVIPMPGEKVPECHSGLCPEKELPEWHSITKIPLHLTHTKQRLKVLRVNFLSIIYSEVSVLRFSV
jgi:hypothetical protein